MNILVACEFSGIVRDAFIADGHDAISCDLLPTESPGPHIQGDVRPLLRKPWDLVIAHPPCTYLSNAGVSAFVDHPDRWERLYASIDFFSQCWTANAPLIAVENPLMHKYAAEHIGNYDQICRPWWFGHPSNKAVCWWLYQLPPLLATLTVPRQEWSKPSKQGWMGASAHSRSRFYPGMATAMAQQWGSTL